MDRTLPDTVITARPPVRPDDSVAVMSFAWRKAGASAKNDARARSGLRAFIRSVSALENGPSAVRSKHARHKGRARWFGNGTAHLPGQTDRLEKLNPHRIPSQFLRRQKVHVLS